MKQVRKLLHTYQNIIITAVMVIGVIIGVIWGIIPTVEKILTLRGESTTLVKQDGLLRAKVNTLDSSDEDTFKKYLAELSTAVPPDKSLTSVFSTIDGLGT